MTWWVAVSSSTAPSGGDRTTGSVPMIPDAPGLFSICRNTKLISQDISDHSRKHIGWTSGGERHNNSN
jgi:hypothetical protein